MGKLAVVAFRFVRDGSVTREDTAWLIKSLRVAQRRLARLEDNLGNDVTEERHAVELTEYGFRVEHTRTCGGVPVCPIHYRLTTEYQDTDGFEALENGLYLVGQAWDGTLVWERKGETDGQADA